MKAFSVFRRIEWRGRVAGALLLALVLTALPTMPAAHAASSCTVAVSGAMYPTIQAAVDDTTCATIDVAAGTYTENVTITRDVTITGASQDTTIVDGNNAGTVFHIQSGTVKLANLTIQHGSGYFFSMYGAEFTEGGGIFNRSTLTVTNSTISNNSADSGGGIYNHLGVLTVINSTISNNSTSYGGGGIWNSAYNGSYYYASARMTVTNSTISNNSADSGGGINSISNYPLILVNSIVANVPFGGACVGTINTAGSRNTLIDDAGNACGLTNGVDGNIVGKDAQLGPLTNNGGPTQTHALLSGSPTIDAGSDADCPAVDQRGVSRPQGAHCDIGAYESQHTLIYKWSGFLQPVDNLPTVNTVKAGGAVPIKFSLGGNQGLAIFAAGSPASRQITCDSGAPVDDIEQIVTASTSSLQYDAASDTYSYVWKTDKAWAGSCRQFSLTLLDGTTHSANFKFR